MGDLNGWVENRMQVEITGAFAVQGENDNGKFLTSDLKSGCV